jgi:ketosteroid isomerase-like protein
MTTMTRTMTPTITDQELLELERQYWDAIKARDARTVNRLTDQESTVAGASGVSGWNAEAVAKAFDAPQYTVKDYRIDPQTVRINAICDDVVSIAYGVHENIEMADGKPVKLDAFDTSVWKKTDNGWACVLHTESLKGDPFGRDRMLVQTNS